VRVGERDLPREEQQAEEGVEHHRRDEQDEPQRVRRSARPGIGADQHVDEEVADEREVHDHEHVRKVSPQHEVEQGREVERRHGDDEVQGGDHGVPEEARPSAVQQREQRLTRARRAVGAPRQGTQPKADGGGEHVADRQDDDEHHVLQHVPAQL